MYVAVYARDKPGQDALRHEVLAAHRAYLETARGGVTLHLSGPLIEDSRMCGSLFVYEGETREEVRRFVEADPIVQSGLYASLDIQQFDWRRGAPT